jgi:peptide/nickel transport system ATP-binding protein
MFECKRLEIFDGDNHLVDISFDIKSSLALVGESGSGKSLSIKAILNLLPQNLSMKFDYKSDFELRCGEEISFVPQNPFTSLSPLTKIKHQFNMDLKYAKENLHLVNLDISTLDRYPSELSGGQLQRVIIAMSLSRNLKLLLLDEPTTALDSLNKNLVLNLIKSLQDKMGFKILFVTHDINSTEILCKDIAVLHRGKIIERGEDLLNNPKSEYTKNLIEASFSRRGFRE